MSLAAVMHHSKVSYTFGDKVPLEGKVPPGGKVSIVGKVPI